MRRSSTQRRGWISATPPWPRPEPEAAAVAAAAAAASPAAIGAFSEDPKAFGKALIFVVLGEGVALYGLLISILIINNL